MFGYITHRVLLFPGSNGYIAAGISGFDTVFVAICKLGKLLLLLDGCIIA